MLTPTQISPLWHTEKWNKDGKDDNVVIRGGGRVFAVPGDKIPPYFKGFRPDEYPTTFHPPSFHISFSTFLLFSLSLFSLFSLLSLSDTLSAYFKGFQWISDHFSPSRNVFFLLSNYVFLALLLQWSANVMSREKERERSRKREVFLVRSLCLLEGGALFSV